MERGVPAEPVRFIHEARNDREKAELFAQCRSGAISVLIGSTEKMGVGTNVQARAVALHHLDCPWRPADIEQREGRILRQGNLNPDVEILRYVTESSFDVFMWGTVERKAAFIAQVTRGDTELARQLDDVGEQSLSYGEVKALATGNPADHGEGGCRLRSGQARTPGGTPTLPTSAAWRRPSPALGQPSERLEHEIDLLEAALERREDISGEAFTATITGVTCDKRTEAGERIKEALFDARHRFGQTMTIGHLAGFDLAVAVKGDAGETELHLHFPEVPIRPVIIGAADIDQEHPSGLVTRLTNRLGDLEERLSNDVTELTSIRRDAVQADELLGKPFDQVGRLANLRARQAEITDALTPKPGEAEAVDNGASAGQLASASERETSVVGVELPEAATGRISDGLAADVVGGGGSSLDLDDDLDLERELADELSMTEAGR